MNKLTKNQFAKLLGVAPSDLKIVVSRNRGCNTASVGFWRKGEFLAQVDCRGANGYDAKEIRQSAMFDYAEHEGLNPTPSTIRSSKVAKSQQQSESSYEYQQAARRTREIGETADCAVKALAIISDPRNPYLGYDPAYEALRKAGRRPSKGTFLHQIESGCRQLGIVATDVTEERRKLPYGKSTGGIKRRPTKWSGKWLIFTGGHILAVIDGVIHDHGVFKNKTIKRVWKIED